MALLLNKKAPRSLEGPFFLFAAVTATSASRTGAVVSARAVVACAILIAAIATLILCFHDFVFLIKQLFTIQRYRKGKAFTVHHYPHLVHNFWILLSCRLPLTDLFKIRWCKPGNLFKLRREMVATAETSLKSNFRKAETIVNQQLLYFFDPVVNEIFFNGNSFHGREQIAQITIIIW